jgi:hypothetical protein
MGNRKVSLADKLKRVDEMQFQGVKKGQGVDVFFKSEDDEENIEKVNDLVDTHTVTSPCTDTQPKTGTVIEPLEDTESVLDSLLNNSEQFVRCVAYLRKEQSDFIKDLSKQLTKKNKGKRIKESEIVRMAMDMLMDAVKK